MLTFEDLIAIGEQHREDLQAAVTEFSIGTKFFPFNSQPHTMGVINLSGDSWYRESVCLDSNAAIRRARVLHAQGADIIDIGAESSLAHAARADEYIQNSKLLPVIRAVREFHPVISIETYQIDVARHCLEAGANVINLTGAFEEQMYELIGRHQAAVIICYVQGKNVREVGDFKLSDDPVPMMMDYFSAQIALAAKHGVQKIFIDPGLGFYYRNLQDSAVRVRYQMKTFLNTFRFRKLGFPTCNALPHAFEYFGDEVRSAEPYFAVLAALGRTDLLRTHEIAKTKGVLATMGAF